MGAQLKLPEDRTSELYFDTAELKVGFRKRSPSSKGKTPKDKVLRVVIQAYGAVVEERIFNFGATITIGSSRRSTFRIPTQELPQKHPLFRYRGEGRLEIKFNRYIGGVLEVAGSLKELSELDQKPVGSFKTVETSKMAKGCLEHGNILIYFEEIEAPSRIPQAPIIKQFTDKNFYRWLLASIGIHLLILLIVHLMPPPAKEVTLKTLSPAQKRMILQPKKVEKYIPKLAMRAPTRGTGVLRGGVGKEGEGARAKGREGKRGKGVKGARAGKKSGKTRRMSRADIRKTGALDALASLGKSGAFDDLIGKGDGLSSDSRVKSGFNRAARYGLPGERNLREGKGLVDRGGVGGGGTTNINPMGGLGKKGFGGGAKGSGLADFGTGKSDILVSATIEEEEILIMGNIPKEVIDRIIRNYLGQIRYCYERELTQKPKLRGKIITDFTIGLEGRVTQSRIKKSTMRDAAVEACIASVIRRIKFPKPGGGIVQVFYPFIFRVAG